VLLVNTFSKLFSGGSGVLPDPTFSALPGLAGLHQSFPPRGALIDPVQPTSQFPHLVSHFLVPPSLDGFIISDSFRFVNTFSKLFFAHLITTG
jgi:hypothetical protein